MTCNSPTLRGAASPRRSRWIAVAFAGGLGFLLGCVVALEPTFAESTSQSFTVNVPASSVVQRPAETSVNVALEAGEQSFPAQSWQIRRNSVTGLVVDFAVHTPFVHSEVASYQMDTSLEVAVSSPVGIGRWTVPQPQSQTRVAESQSDASVRVQTDNIGVADIALTVGVSEANLTELMPGTYRSTVHVTIMPR